MAKKTPINRLKIVLAERDVSQKKLAEMVGVDPTTISRICTNDNQPTLRLLREIAIALGVNIQLLLVATPDKHNK
jgi:putative transcriptional regulator